MLAAKLENGFDPEHMHAEKREPLPKLSSDLSSVMWQGFPPINE